MTIDSAWLERELEWTCGCDKGFRALHDSDARLMLAEIERLRSAMKVTRQALLEVNHAQEVGTSWYTRGESGLRSQVAMWVRKGLDAARDVLESERS